MWATIDVSIRWGADDEGKRRSHRRDDEAANHDSGTRDMAEPPGHDDRTATAPRGATAGGVPAVAWRLPGAAGAERGRRAARALIGTRVGHRLGAQPAVPP